MSVTLQNGVINNIMQAFFIYGHICEVYFHIHQEQNKIIN